MVMMFTLTDPTVFAVSGVLAALCLSVYLFLIPRPYPGIPHHADSAKRPLGDVPGWRNHSKTKQTIFDWAAAQGLKLNSPIFQLFVRPIGKPVVFLTDPRESNDVLLRRSRDFDVSPFHTDIFIGIEPNHHTISLTDDRWRAQRRLLNDTMKSDFLRNVAAAHVHRQIQCLMELWKTKAARGHGHAFWAVEDIRNMAMDTVWTVAFGSSTDAIDQQTEVIRSALTIDKPSSASLPVIFPERELPADFKAVIYLGDSIAIPVRSALPRLAHWWYRQSSTWKKAFAIKDKLIAERLDDAKQRLLRKDATDASIKCATDNMVFREKQAAAKEGREPGYDTPAAKAELLGFLLAGHDTTATAINWGVKFLADNPRVQSKLREEIRAAYPDAVKTGTLPSAAQICNTRIPYLDATVDEILRLGRPTPVLTRRATVDTELLGYKIPKGTDLVMLSIAQSFVEPDPFTVDEKTRSQSSRDAKGRVGVWDDDDISEFKPERWLRKDENGELEFHSRSGPSQPFGGGLRGCFGRALAYLVMRTLWTIMMLELELKQAPESLSGYDFAETFTRKPFQCYVLPVPLNSGN